MLAVSRTLPCTLVRVFSLLGTALASVLASYHLEQGLWGNKEMRALPGRRKITNRFFSKCSKRRANCINATHNPTHTEARKDVRGKLPTLNRINIRLWMRQTYTRNAQRRRLKERNRIEYPDTNSATSHHLISDKDEKIHIEGKNIFHEWFQETW